MPLCAVVICGLLAGASAAASGEVRFDFESGDLQGWHVVEGQFDLLICNKEFYRNHPTLRYNKHGQWFLSTIELKNGHGNDQMTGVVESPVFVLTGPDLSLQVGGGDHADTYVALCTEDGAESQAARGRNTEAMSLVRWHVPELVGKKVFLRVVDRNTGGWGHVILDNVVATGQIDPAATAAHFLRAKMLLDTQRLRQQLLSELKALNLTTVRQAVEDLGRDFPGEYPYPGLLERIDQGRQELSSIASSVAGGDAADLDRALARLRQIQALVREALLSNPLVRRRPILYVMRAQYIFDHHNTETMFQTGEISTPLFRGGSAMKAIDLAAGGRVTTLLESKEGNVRDPEVYFDGGRILFSMRKNIRDDYHIYEMNVDGSGLRQLTAAAGVSDIDPFYLPDDTIVFSSTREPKFCMCNRHVMANLFRMDADGANIAQIGKNTLFEGHGSVMPDGRILYDRWEYVDRNFGDAQGLWTCNPDGTNHAVYWGNNTPSPGGVIDARIIPGLQQAVCTLTSCHDHPWGAIAVIDRRLGLDGRPPVVRSWPASAVDLVKSDGNNLFDDFTRVNPKYEDPYPLSDAVTGAGAGKHFLCSRMTGRDKQMGVYLIDVFGNETLVHVEDTGCFDPMPLGPRTRPPRIPSRRNFEGKDGRFYVLDVYRGTHMEGVRRGEVKYLRVVESPEKRFWTRPAWNGQGQEAPAMGWHDFNNKRILGTVPVEADGSANFRVPADTFVYFQLLDENGMMIQSMRSGTFVQSGETTGCVGCHDERRTAPPPAAGKNVMALQRSADRLKDWYGPARLFSFAAEVQPVFNKHCLSCHDYGKKAAGKLNLSGDRTLVFNVAYEELWFKKYVRSIGAGPAQTQKANSWGSRRSKLGEEMLNRMKDGRIDRESFDRVVSWIDINAPYYPTYASAYPDGLAGRAPLDEKRVRRFCELTGVSYDALWDHGRSQGAQVNVDRPELSPCLERLRASAAGQPAAQAKYAEALGILREAKAALASRPRGDTEEGFEACPLDQQRQQKYAMSRHRESDNRRGIVAGEKVYDKP